MFMGEIFSWTLIFSKHTHPTLKILVIGNWRKKTVKKMYVTWLLYIVAFIQHSRDRAKEEVGEAAGNFWPRQLFPSNLIENGDGARKYLLSNWLTERVSMWNTCVLGDLRAKKVNCQIPWKNPLPLSILNVILKATFL